MIARYTFFLLMDMSKTTRQCFSNGYEWDRWAEHNCERCIKNSHLKPNGTYSLIKCAVQRDIFNQAMGQEEIYTRSFEATQASECPYFCLVYSTKPRTRHRPLPVPPNQLTISFPE